VALAEKIAALRTRMLFLQKRRALRSRIKKLLTFQVAKKVLAIKNGFNSFKRKLIREKARSQRIKECDSLRRG